MKSKITEEQLKQARSIIATENVSVRWKNSTKEQRKEQGRMLAEARKKAKEWASREVE